jgi:uncharacterized protein YjbI with pentapeptide repeats
MKKGWIIALIAVFIIGWSLGYLSLPYLPGHYQFWLGASSVLSALILFYILKVKAFGNQKLTLISLSLLIILFSTGLFLFDRMLDEKQRSNQQAQELMKERLEQELKMIYAQEQIHQKRLIERVLHSFDKQQDVDRLVEELVQLMPKLKAVERSFMDSVIEVSPGKGYLLQSIFESKLNDSSRRKIIGRIDFSRADLEFAVLQKRDLSHIKLNNALLYQAVLSGSSLQDAQLESSILRECQLDSARLKQANIKKADLQWSNLDHTDLRSVLALGADFSHGSIQNSKLDSAKMAWAILENTLLRKSTFNYTDLLSAVLIHSDFSSADLRNARLSRAKFDRAVLEDAVLGNNAVSEDWMNMLIKSEVVGKESIVENYQVVEDSSAYFSIEKFFLRSKAIN